LSSGKLEEGIKFVFIPKTILHYKDVKAIDHSEFCSRKFGIFAIFDEIIKFNILFKLFFYDVKLVCLN
jgi:hypothetical protein